MSDTLISFLIHLLTTNFDRGIAIVVFCPVARQARLLNEALCAKLPSTMLVKFTQERIVLRNSNAIHFMPLSVYGLRGVTADITVVLPHS